MNTMTNYDVITLIAPISTSGTITGTGVDLANYDIERNVKIFAEVGAVTTAGTIDIKIQDGATSTPATDLDTTGFTQVTSTAGAQEWELKLRGQRYLRAVATLSTGTYTFGVYAVVAKRFS